MEASVLQVASSCSTRRRLDLPVRRNCTSADQQVLNSVAVPDIAGRDAIKALPHSAEGHREDSWFSVFVRISD